MVCPAGFWTRLLLTFGLLTMPAQGIHITCNRNIITLICFSTNTTVLRANHSAGWTKTPLENVRVGEVLQSLDPSSGRLVSTSVTHIERIIGGSSTTNFVAIDAVSSSGHRYGLRVTAQHAMIVERLGRLFVTRAENMSRGDVLLTGTGTRVMIQSLIRSATTEPYIVLHTDSGHVLASSLLTTTFCDRFAPANASIPFEKAMQ